MVKLNKYLILMQLFVLTLIGQSIIQCASRIQTEQSATNLDLELIEAVTYGNKEKVKQLIEAGANVDAIDKYGCTALMVAAWAGNKGIVELLIKANADVNIANKYLYTALIWAACFGYKEIVELLLCAGADISHKNKDGDMAIDLNKQEIVKMLEGEPARRVGVVKKWSKEHLARKITEATSEQLFSDISNIIGEYITIKYTAIPLEYRLVN